ncbi:MAG: family 10 glycosylhydrolase [Cyclonatronaceae bacterium]
MKKIPALVLILLLSGISVSVHANPKHEFRGAWIATVLNLDWPTSRTATPAFQRAQLIAKLDNLKATGINAVFFQVRTEADALYDSPYEPWSYYLTGSEGRAPDPYWDPLAFAIDEAHKRGMELHAWLNPYRAVRNTGSFTRSSDHLANTRPDWILTFGTLKILNPGIPEVKEHLVKIVRDIVQRYNVDGIHFDDYFYPYSPNEITDEDAETFAEFGGDFTNIGDWRRDNINRMVEAVHATVKEEKPHVAFGVSPFGIWRPGNPPGITGTDAYNSIYADAKAWLADQSVDYLVPQIYWAFGGGQDYGALAPWWKETTGSRHMYSGNAAYKMLAPWDWPVTELTNQLQLNRDEGIPGIVFFRSTMLTSNQKGLADALSSNYFSTPALTPTMPWLDTTPPPPPVQLSASRTGVDGTGVALQWEHPVLSASAIDTTSRYVVYRYQSATPPDPLLIVSDASNIVDITGLNRLTDVVSISGDPYHYVVTSVSSNGIESDPVMISVDAVPTGILADREQPFSVELLPNYPNPFNPTTTIPFSLPEADEITITVYDQMGQRLAVLQNGPMPAGMHTVVFDARHLASGVYLYRIVGAGFTETRKMMLIK